MTDPPLTGAVCVLPAQVVFLKACTHARRTGGSVLKYATRSIQYYNQKLKPGVRGSEEKVKGQPGGRGGLIQRGGWEGQGFVWPRLDSRGIVGLL